MWIAERTSHICCYRLGPTVITDEMHHVIESSIKTDRFLNGVWHVVGVESPHENCRVGFNEQAPTERGHTCVNEPGFMWRGEVSWFESCMKTVHLKIHKARANCC